MFWYQGCCLFPAVAVAVSCFTLVSISLERYFAICRPLHSRQWQTLKHSYRIIVVCWLVAFIFCIPVALNTQYMQLPRGNWACREIWREDMHGWHVAYTIFLDSVLLVLPVTIMTFSYGKISYTLWAGMKLDSQEMGKTLEPFFCKVLRLKIELPVVLNRLRNTMWQNSCRCTQRVAICHDPKKVYIELLRWHLQSYIIIHILY